MKRVLFLCTGNYYRSRFAELLFNHQAAQRGIDWVADSRALALELGINNVGPISHYTVTGLQARGVMVDATHRLPQQVTEADLTLCHICDVPIDVAPDGMVAVAGSYCF